MGLRPAILDNMAADRFSRLQEVRDKAEILEHHIQHMRTMAGATHTAMKDDNRPGKRKRTGWYKGQGASQTGTPHMGGAIQSYPTPAPPPEAPAQGNGGCFNCGQSG